MAIAVVIPGQFGVRGVSRVYARRRLMVMLGVAIVVLVLFAGAGQVVANRGGAPASASTIRPANAAAPAEAVVTANVYVVQTGDTLWSIGERFHGQTSLVDYVDALVSANGGSEILVSQALTLP